MRKEQGKKLKQFMQKKREEDKKKNEIELTDLVSLKVLKESDAAHFKEELANRKLTAGEYE